MIYFIFKEVYAHGCYISLPQIYFHAGGACKQLNQYNFIVKYSKTGWSCGSGSVEFSLSVVSERDKVINKHTCFRALRFEKQLVKFVI